MAAYMATETNPEHPNVVALRETAYQILMRPTTVPVPVRLWIRDRHDSKHEGCTTAFIEMVTSVDDVESGWHHYCDSTDIDSRTCASKGQYSYASLYCKFV